VLNSVLNFAALFNLDIGYLGFNCDFSHAPYITILVLKILMPVFFFVAVLLENLGLKLFRKLKSFEILKVFSNFIFAVNFFSIQLFGSMFQVFNCVDTGGGRYVVSQEPSISCFSQEWNQFVGFDVVFIVFYVIVVPGCVIWLFKRAQRNHDQFTLDVLINPITEPYRKGAEWFEIVRFVFRLCFVLVRDAFQMTSGGKILFLGFMLMALQWIEASYSPYTNHRNRDLSLL
jgi:hypothetical protein